MPLVFQVQCDTNQIIVVETPLLVALSQIKAETEGGGGVGGERDACRCEMGGGGQDVACGHVNNRQH